MDVREDDDGTEFAVFASSVEEAVLTAELAFMPLESPHPTPFSSTSRCVSSEYLRPMTSKTESRASSASDLAANWMKTNSLSSLFPRDSGKRRGTSREEEMWGFNSRLKTRSNVRGAASPPPEIVVP